MLITSSPRQNRFHLKSTGRLALYWEILLSDGGRCDRHRKCASGRRSGMAFVHFEYTFGTRYQRDQSLWEADIFFQSTMTQGTTRFPLTKDIAEKGYFVFPKECNSIWHLRLNWLCVTYFIPPKLSGNTLKLLEAWGVLPVQAGLSKMSAFGLGHI